MSVMETTILVAAFGASLQELVTWYNLRNTLSSDEHRELLHSAAYWAITVLMILASGIGTWIWYNGEKHPLRECLLAGAAFPLLVKKGVSAVIGGGETKLGRLAEGDDSSPARAKLALTKYFQSN